MQKAEHSKHVDSDQRLLASYMAQLCGFMTGCLSVSISQIGKQNFSSFQKRDSLKKLRHRAPSTNKKIRKYRISSQLCERHLNSLGHQLFLHKGGVLFLCFCKPLDMEDILFAVDILYIFSCFYRYNYLPI